jgi:beta-glucanase (GH16 family)
MTLSTAIWMMPQNNKYGGWPMSGEIDIMESRGNRNLEENGKNIGVEQVCLLLKN